MPTLYGRWTLPVEEGVFWGLASWKLLGHQDHILHNWLCSWYPTTGQNLWWSITPRVSPPQYDELAAFVLYWPLVDRTGRPILTRTGWNDANWRRKVSFGGHSDSKFHLRVFFHTEIPKFAMEEWTNIRQILDNVTCDRTELGWWIFFREVC